jgi:carbon monoxide dehydrogenase subunit G
MAEGAAKKQVSAAPDAVWAVVGKFDGVAEFFPGIDSFSTEGDDRLIGMFGMQIRERLVARDDATMTLEYAIVDGVPLESHKARITVVPDGDGSLVTWAFEVEPPEMVPVFDQTYGGALEVLAAKLS